MNNFQKGDWVACKSDTLRPEIGKIKECHSDLVLGDGIDVVIYDIRGNKIGRTSPAMGGPTSFEPFCSPDNWVKIKKPNFPLRGGYFGWANEITYLENGN